jgi:hypothetical protein
VTRANNLAPIAAAAFLALACGSSAESPNAIDAAPGGAFDAPAETTVDARTGTMIDLIESGWTLPGGSEEYRCVRKTLTQDLLIDRFEPIGPLGTHHTVLSVGDGSGPDGEFRCDSTVLSPQIIYVSGVQTPAMEMPANVVMRVNAGEQLLLNLHLFNTSPAPLSGRSGVRVRVAAGGDGAQEAEAVLAGTLSLDIQPGIDVETGRCRLPTATHVFAVAPHMHQLGIHQKVTVEGSGQVLLDRDYHFDAQDFVFVDAALPAGSTVRVDCTYDNPGMVPVGWGESSNLEMCFAILYRYPATGRFGVCVGG